MPPRTFQRVTFSLPPVMLEEIKAEAERRDLTLSQLVREYIRSGRLRDTGGLDLKRAEDTNDDATD